MSELKAYGDTMRGNFNSNTTESNTYAGTPQGFTMSNNKKHSKVLNFTRYLTQLRSYYGLMAIKR